MIGSWIFLDRISVRGRTASANLRSRELFLPMVITTGPPHSGDIGRATSLTGGAIKSVGQRWLRSAAVSVCGPATAAAITSPESTRKAIHAGSGDPAYNARMLLCRPPALRRRSRHPILNDRPLVANLPLGNETVPASYAWIWDITQSVDKHSDLPKCCGWCRHTAALLTDAWSRTHTGAPSLTRHFAPIDCEYRD